MTNLDRTEQGIVIATVERLWRASGAECRVIAWSSLADALGSSSGVESPDGPEVVVVPTANVVECVGQSTTALEAISKEVGAIRSRGWIVNVLVRYQDMGAAHEIFRGLNVSLQGWRKTESELSFMPKETA